MTSLINKIEEKFSSSSTSSRDNEEPNKLQKSNVTSEYSSGNKADPTNSSSSRIGDSTTSGSDYGQQTTSSEEGGPVYNGVDGLGSNLNTSSTSQYAEEKHDTNANRRIPGSWDTTDRTTTGTSGLAQDSSRDNATPRQPLDPYSSHGQQTAADTVTGSNANESRSQRGGVTSANGQTTSNHHYGRDAGIFGGTGAAGLGAYEAGKYSGTSSISHYESGRTFETPRNQEQGHGTKSGLSNVSYMNRDNNLNGQHNSNNRPFSDESSGRYGVGAMDPNPHSISDRALARKMGAAYEAGYRDALEHLRAEYHQQQQDSYERHGYGTNGAGNGAGGNSAYSSNNYGANEKPSISDKLNPKKDADRDGKAGIMS